MKWWKGFLWGVVVLSGLFGGFGLLIGGMSLMKSDEVALIMSRVLLTMGALAAFLSGMVYTFFLKE